MQKPHRVETFKMSHHPEFAEKLEDIVGFYLNPPEHALVLCVEEKSQIQALDRTQPGLPLKRGRSQTRADRGCVAFLGQHYFVGNGADFSVMLKLENVCRTNK